MSLREARLPKLADKEDVSGAREEEKVGKKLKVKKNHE